CVDRPDQASSGELPRVRCGRLRWDGAFERARELEGPPGARSEARQGFFREPRRGGLTNPFEGETPRRGEFEGQGMTAASLQDFLPPGGGGAERFKNGEGVGVRQAVELQFPQAVSGQVVRPDEPEALPGEEEELDCADRRVEADKVPKKDGGLGAR